MADLLVAHIGSPKTATTTLQVTLRESRPKLENAGICYVGPRAIRETGAFSDFWKYYRDELPDLNSDAFNEILYKFVDTKPEGCRNRIFLSEESITHDLMPTRAAPGGFTRIDKSCAFVHGIKADRKKILLTVRRQDRFLVSCYTHTVHRHQETSEFHRWVDEVADLERFSWLKVIEDLCASFGSENVEVVPFEMIKTQGFIPFVFRCLSPITDKAIELNQTKPNSNESLGARTLPVAIEINKLAESASASEQINSRLISSSQDEKFEPPMKYISKYLRNLFQEENREIMNRYFPDIDSDFCF
jgi:hypothetical protein